MEICYLRVYRLATGYLAEGSWKKSLKLVNFQRLGSDNGFKRRMLSCRLMSYHWNKFTKFPIRSC